MVLGVIPMSDHDIRESDSHTVSVYEYRGPHPGFDAVNTVKSHHAERAGVSYGDLQGVKLEDGDWKDPVVIAVIHNE